MRVLVLGSGISGRAAVDLAHRMGDAVTVVDPEGHYEGSTEVAVSSTLTPGLLENCDVVVASPGIPEDDPMIRSVVDRGIPLWSEIEYAYRHLEEPVVAITGTNGKTTVTQATALMLQKAGVDVVAVGNVGDPLSGAVGSDTEVAVAEVSSFQLANIDKFHPVSSAVLNVAPDHLDWHRDMTSYENAKARIFENQTSDEICVYDADDPGAARLVKRAPARTIAVSGRRRPDDGWGVEEDVLRVGPVTVALSDVVLSDPPSLSNLAISAVLALDVGANATAVEEVMRSFRPDTHRRTLVAEIDGVRWVNDSKATNPHAALAAIAAETSVILIAGGLAKGLDNVSLAYAAGVRYVIGLGTSGPDLVDAAQEGTMATDIADAVRIANTIAEPGDTVLLAPGGASFDQFDSYAHRGDRFTEEVGLIRRQRQEMGESK
ncbi:MAG: UDP-N-acetylmuramoyl-L-alanine--D-glutamate ligase [Acidimicrobiia bacterium]|nr:UDP-N-acetylmuramoyl-L-alanine--D-glutamate ligase [Acidimicrobiia bacterium]